MGGKIAVARIKATINLANARTEAKAAKAQLDAETERMCEMIASGETPYLAPTKKPKAKEGEVESAESDAANVAGGLHRVLQLNFNSL